MLIETLKQKLKPNFIGEVCSQNSIHFFITEFDKHTNTDARTYTWWAGGKFSSCIFC
jgi:hypothetical protein